MSWFRRPLWSGRMSRYRLNTGQVVGANPASLSSSVRNGVAVAMVVFGITTAVASGMPGSRAEGSVGRVLLDPPDIGEAPTPAGSERTRPTPAPTLGEGGRAAHARAQHQLESRAPG